MKEKEQAVELFETFTVQEFNESRGWYTNEEETKLVAKCVVKEILKVLFQPHEIDYWKQVDAEIENL